MSHHNHLSRVPVLWPTQDLLIHDLMPWLLSRRWCPVFEIPNADDVRIVADHELAPHVHALVVEFTTERGEALRVHVPLVMDAPERLDAVGSDTGFMSSGRAFVDGAQHPEYWRAWAIHSLTQMREPLTGQDVARCFEIERVVSGEQSNTSVILYARRDYHIPGLPDRLIAKVIRIVSAGPNPDVEVPAALADSGWACVPRPLAWSSISWPTPYPAQSGYGEGEQWTHSVVVTSFIPNAQDGFTMLCTVDASPLVGNEAPQRSLAVKAARAVGVLTAQMHERLRVSLGEWPSASGAQVAQCLRERAQWAFDEIGPQIAQAWPTVSRAKGEEGLGAQGSGRVDALRGRVEALYGQVAGLPSLPGLIRIHGDYHLGQTLYQPDDERWFVVDFEGEPLRPAAVRVLPDLAVRDVAGMLRSFDYAAARGTNTDAEWLSCVRLAFLDAYWEESGGPTPGDDLLIRAFETDKALYEAVYEAKNRPAWLPIPIRGLQALILS